MDQALTVIPITIRKLKRVNMRLPPAHLFEEPLGYADNKRFFALCWSRVDQAPILNDGFSESFGEPDLYRVWRFNPVVRSKLIGYNIGDAAITADHMLLVDRKLRILYIGKVWDVLEVLDLQKNGTSEPRNETCNVCNSGTPMEMRDEGKVTAKNEDKKMMSSGIKLLDELEAWINANIT